MGSAGNWVKGNKFWLVACVALAAGGYGAGRYAQPAKIVLQTVTEFREVAAKTTTKGPVVAKKHTIIEVLPGGGRRTTTDLTLERGPVVTLETRATEKKDTTTSTTVYEAPRLTLGPTLAWDGGVRYGAFLSYRVAGPLVLMGQGEGGAGGWSARAGVGLNF